MRLDETGKRVQFRIVQVREWTVNNAIAITNTASSAAHVGSRGAVERPALHCSANIHLAEIHPCLAGQLDRGLFHALNRVTIGNRLGRASGMTALIDGEGMARVERQPSPLNRCRPVVRFTKAGRCNRGPREKASVGGGDHCARRFQMRSDRPTEEGHAKANHFLNLKQGWFMLAPSLWKNVRQRSTQTTCNRTQN